MGRNAGRISLPATAFVTAALYYCLASATAGPVAHAIAAGGFYAHSDFGIATWQAGLALRAGDVAGLYHRQWLYPPPMALPAMAISLLPLPYAFWIWAGGSNLLAAALLRFAGLGWRVIGAGLAGPAMFYDILLGQNGALTGGLIVAALLLMRRRPGAGGMLAGALCLKPQIGCLLPVVLLRNAGAILPCVLTAATLATLATLMTGGRGWELFFEVAQPVARAQLDTPFGQQFQMASITVFIAARSLGCGLAAAWAVQGLSSAAAVAATWRLWSKPDADNTARMAATICLAMLAVPFGFSYDLIGFSVAVAALAARAPAAQIPILAALWLWPGLTGLLTTDLHVVLMPIAAVIGAILAWNRLDPPAPIR